MSSLLLYRTRMAIHNEPSAYPHFRLVGAKEAARLAAAGLPFTEHCHGETVKTEPVETKRHLVLKVVTLVGVVGVLWMLGEYLADLDETYRIAGLV